MGKDYTWQYCSLGGVTRVMITSGEDIAHLGELDQKLWTVLSCPADGLELDPQTVKFIDTDNDGKIRVAEVVAAANLLTKVIKNRDLILRGDTTLPLGEINTDTPEGEKLYNSAKQILKNLSSSAEEISLEQASDSTAIFAGSKFNGDGIITTISTDDPNLQATIADIITCSAKMVDRCGENGIDAEAIEAFYAACADYAQWQAVANNSEIIPYGDKTAALLDAITALKEKVADFFTRCKLLRFDKQTAQTVAIEVTSLNDIVKCPIAAPNEEGLLNLKAINPAWQDAIAKIVALLPQFENKETICEEEWNELCASLNPYTAWIGAKAGAAVESLGIDRVQNILLDNQKEALFKLIEADKALEAESNSIDDVKNMMLLYRDFYQFLQNFVTFSDFYKRERRATFEVGKLYIDQRCCDLCIRVSDMSKHADMAKLSGMFLIYCTCTSKKQNKSMNIVAALTDGSVTDIQPGKNGIFYDCKGDDWDAVVTKVVDNPINIKQAFWAPYKKFWDFCVGLINKSASDKDKKITDNLQAKATTAISSSGGEAATPKEAKAPFDIAKFAGIFAAIGLALGTIGSFITGIADGVRENPLGLLYAIIAIMVIISGPSCFIAWSKLKKRNLGPVLNANGWAINSKVLINILFGAKLTEVAKYPVSIGLVDPYVKKKSNGWKWIVAILLIIALIATYYFFLKK